MLFDQDRGFGLPGTSSTIDALNSNNKYGNGLGAYSYESYLSGAPAFNSPTSRAADISAYNNTPGLFGITKGTWGDIGTMGNLGLSAIGTYAGLKNLGLAERAFDFNKGMAEKEYAMSKDAYDKNVARAQSISDQMAAGKVG